MRTQRSEPPLTLRQAFDAGHKVFAYCRRPGCSGRQLEAKRLSPAIMDRAISELVERRAFRCERCGPGPITILVNEVRVGVSVRVAEFQQDAYGQA